MVNVIVVENAQSAHLGTKGRQGDGFSPLRCLGEAYSTRGMPSLPKPSGTQGTRHSPDVNCGLWKPLGVFLLNDFFYPLFQKDG